MELLTAVSIGILFAVGIFQILRRNVIRSIIGLLILMNAVNLFLFSMGAYRGLAPAYSTALAQPSDALPQALVLTAIVIGMGGIALLLSMLYIISARWHTSDQDEVSALKD